jgi:N-acetylmuramoyl-L-alanine amidase
MVNFMKKYTVSNKKSLLLLGLGALVVGLPQARSSDDIADKYRASKRAPVKSALGVTSQKPLALNPSDIFSRTQSVLQYFQVPAEADFQSDVSIYDNAQSEAGLKALLVDFDPKLVFNEFSTASQTEVSVFQDRATKRVPDFNLQLRDESAAAPASAVLEHLKAAQSNSADQALAGLKIILDPGHMGTTLWDQRTGKYVHDAQGHTLSEGVINLQTALLLEDKLKALGADVMLTRKSLGPVLTTNYDTFDYENAAREELADENLTEWFQHLLSVASPGAALYAAFSNNSEVKHLFSEEMHATLFNSADLEARADAIVNFNADIALMIHYDSSSPVHDPNGLNPNPAGSADSTKVYVSGAFDPTELATRDDRAQFAMHLADEAPWRASLSLGHSILSSMTSELKIPAEHGSPGITKEIEPGLFSRNLALLKRHTNAVVDYVECLFYNDRKEFQLISETTHPMTIDGQSYPYSDRQAEVAEALKDGIVNFVRNGQ